VDHNRSASRLEERSGAVVERDSGVEQRRGAVAVSANFQIQQVAIVLTLRIVLPVLFPRWIEMAARRLEIGTFAFSNRVNVDAMRAGRELGYVHVNAHAPRS